MIRAMFPPSRKQGLTIGMAMTEKQGGSDVRANTTRAVPAGREGPGTGLRARRPQIFRLGADVRRFPRAGAGAGRPLVLPRAALAARRQPRTRCRSIRLKRKMGNASNASSETELRGALGWMVGPEGRGIPTIIEMVAMTRFDCMIGSSAGMRMAVSQAIDHCRQRNAFGALPHRPADDDRGACRPGDRSGGGARARPCASRAPSIIATTRMRTRSSGLAPRSANTGSASARRATPMRRWSVIGGSA